jgi:hypothetical protein
VNNLAGVLQAQGKYEEAEQLNRRVGEGREGERAGTESSLHQRKWYEEASQLYQRACEGYKQKLGPQHPKTVACLNRFSAMRQNVEQDGLDQCRTLTSNSKAGLRGDISASRSRH